MWRNGHAMSERSEQAAALSAPPRLGRRRFSSLLAAALLPALPGAALSKSMTHPSIKPPRLAQGDVIGLIAPAGRIDGADIDQSIQHVEALGFRAKPGLYLKEVQGNYAGSVEQRLADLHRMFLDPEVKAIWCIRGGSGAIGLLRHIDYGLIRAHPKILLGYSDITALHLAIRKMTGLVTFHGPVALSTPNDYANRHLLAVLTDPQPRYTIPMAQENAAHAREAPAYAVRTVHGGVATGTLIGGNLSLVSALAGTPYAADFRNSLLFLEEVNEEPYRIDRWMTQLDLSTGFDRAAGIMIGICEGCEPQGGPGLTLEQALATHLAPLTIPAVSGYSFGHIRHQFTLPVGVRVRLDTGAQTVTLLEPAVS
jgi:muramoyltetrapeptide carboxypeptidase